jgi:YD repeat-containing protein
MGLASRQAIHYSSRFPTMSTATCFAPLLRRLLMTCALVVCVNVHAQLSNSAKKVLHQDGTISESVSDLAKGELRESTFDSRGVLLSKRIVLLNEQGLPLRGVIYSGSDEPLGQVEFYYDDLGRVKEELSRNAQGQPFRRKIQEYDQSGRPLNPKIVDYAANAPKVASNNFNFTKITPSTVQGASGVPAGSPQVKQPGQAPQIQAASPTNPGTTKPPEEKKGLFKRMFKK